MNAASPSPESQFLATPIRDLGLTTIAGTPWQQVVAEFQRGLERFGSITRPNMEQDNPEPFR